LLAVAAVVLSIPLIATLYQLAAARADRRRFAPPGAFVTPSGCRLHVHSMGSGTPTVVLEAGIAASSVGWARVQPAIARFTRVVAYDRAGLAWSGPSTYARSPEQFIVELHAVVESSGTPAILVGHSFGALLARLYAAAHPQHVAGLVLVDPALTSEWALPSPARASALDRGVRLSRRGALLARLGVVRLGLSLASAGAGPAAKAVAHLSSGRGGSATMRRLVGEVTKLPRESWPVVRAHWSRPECFRSMAEHLAVLPQVAAAASEVTDLGSIPIAVISGGHLTPEQLDQHRQLAAISARGRHIVAHDSGHWIHLDQPDIIAQAVREMIGHDHR
jgi:pimeloyl-ACP methyl ester carboxylesterase